VIPFGEDFLIQFDTPVVMRPFKASAAMVLSDNSGVVDDGKVCVEGVNDNCFWEFGFLVFGFAFSGPFSSSSARWNHHRIHETVL